MPENPLILFHAGYYLAPGFKKGDPAGIRFIATRRLASFDAPPEDIMLTLLDPAAPEDQFAEEALLDGIPIRAFRTSSERAMAHAFTNPLWDYGKETKLATWGAWGNFQTQLHLTALAEGVPLPHQFRNDLSRRYPTTDVWLDISRAIYGYVYQDYKKHTPDLFTVGRRLGREVYGDVQDMAEALRKYAEEPGQPRLDADPKGTASQLVMYFDLMADVLRRYNLAQYG